MKKLATIILLFVVVLGLNAQDIITKTGSNGVFYIKNSSDQTEFQFTSDILNDPELIIGKSVASVGADAYMLRIQSGTLSPAISFESITSTANAASLYFQKARGSSTGVNAGDEVGIISYAGYQGSSYHNVANITTKVVSISGSTSPSAKIQFSTSSVDASPTVKMTIGDDGTVTIADLAGTYSGGQAYVIVNDAGDLIASESAPAKNPLSADIQKLKEENQALKAQLQALSDKVDKLISNQ